MPQASGDRATDPLSSFYTRPGRRGPSGSAPSPIPRFPSPHVILRKWGLGKRGMGDGARTEQPRHPNRKTVASGGSPYQYRRPRLIVLGAPGVGPIRGAPRSGIAPGYRQGASPILSFAEG